MGQKQRDGLMGGGVGVDERVCEVRSKQEGMEDMREKGV